MDETDRVREVATRKVSDQIEKLKKDKRRMDELITLKEQQIEKLQVYLQECDGKVREVEYRNAMQAQEFDENLRQVEKRYQREISKMKSELT